jgi:hypothetical protein
MVVAVLGARTVVICVLPVRDKLLGHVRGLPGAILIPTGHI